MTDSGLHDQKPARDRTVRPRDAAALVVVDHSIGEPRALMGRRRADLVFLPNKFVFPGGRVDRADFTAPSIDELAPGQTAKLLLDMKGGASPVRARALALAAVRETFEEAGLMIGARHSDAVLAGSDTASLESEEHEGWPSFRAHGILPRLSSLSYFARAITPPGRPRRYDTRFFCVDATEIVHRVEIPEGELSQLDWFTLDDMRGLDLPGITRVVIEDLADWLQAGLSKARDMPVPFYFHRKGTFERVLLSQEPREP